MNEPNNGSVIGTEAETRTNSGQYNVATRRKQLIHEEHNSAYNHHTLVERLKAGTARDIGAEEKQSGPCFVIGSGPSLDDALPYMKDWKNGIICTTSHALTLMYYGIEPSHILLLDPFCSWDEIAGVDWSQTRTKLVAHPGVWPDIIANWPNEILLYRQNVGRNDSFYATTQKRMYTHRVGDRDEPEFTLLIRTDIMQFACSPPAQMFCAAKLGYGPIFLSGVDFGFHSGKERFTGYTVKREGSTFDVAGNAPAVVIPTEWEEHEYPFDESTVDKDTMIQTNNGLWTAPIHLYYKKNLLSAWRLSLQNVYSTDHGIITPDEMPYADIEKVVKKQGRGFKPWTKSKIISTTERYLAGVGAFILVSENGINFVESANPEVELVAFMNGINRQYVCENCHYILGSNTDADQTGETCPVCKVGKIKRRNKIDIAANMKRINRLIRNTEPVSLLTLPRSTDPADNRRS